MSDTPTPNIVEVKVAVSALTTTIVAAVGAVLSLYVFHGGPAPSAVTGVVTTVVTAVVSGVVTFVAGWLARHTTRVVVTPTVPAPGE